MGKKQTKAKGKFDNVEISSPILDAETIKAIHTPPNQKQKEGGFKALFADSGSQDLLDDISTVNQHLPSYVGISCAISGYTNYSPYLKSARSGHNSPSNNDSNNPNTTTTATDPPPMTSSPLTGTKTSHLNQTLDPYRAKQHYINVKSNQLQSTNETTSSNQQSANGRLTPNITGSGTRRVPSPSIPRKEDDRHHGTCVGARYCLLPPPDKPVNKHIPLLGIDDDKEINDDDELETEANKSVQKRIASLYGDEFAEGWKESNANKARKDTDDSDQVKEKTTKNLKDLVKLKPTPSLETKVEPDDHDHVNLPDTITLSKAPVFAGVEKQFLGQLLSNGVSIKPTSQVPRASNFSARSESTTQKTSHQPIKFDSPTENISIQQPTRDLKELAHDNSFTKIEAVLIGDDSSDSTIKSKKHDTNISDEVDILEIQRHIADQEDGLSINEQVPSSISEQEHIEGSETNLIEHTLTKEPEKNYNDHTEELDIDLEHKVVVPIDSNVYALTDQLDPISVPNDQSQEVSSDILLPQEGILLDLQDNEFTHLKGQYEQGSPQDLLIDTVQEQVMSNKESGPITEPVGEEQVQPYSSHSRDGEYFLDQLKTKSDEITRNMIQAEAILDDEVECQSLDEEVLGKIHSAVGKANLLLNKKCKQFKELCADNLATNDRDGKFVTLNDDLEGFWDMIVIQLNECEDAFNQLWSARENGWKFENDQAQESSSSSSGRSSQHSKQSKPKLNAQKDQERRNRLQEHINQMKQKEAANPQRKNSAELLEDFITEPTNEPHEVHESQEASLLD